MNGNSVSQLILELKNVRKTFVVKTPAGRRLLSAVDNVSLSVPKGRIFGVVGESGCGKSTLARCVVRLTKPTSGGIFFDGHDIASMGDQEFRLYRRRIQMVFQDPTDSLNPRHTVRTTLMEPLYVNRFAEKQKKDKVFELIQMVGLREEHLDRFPHQLSMGQQQRVGIARALATEPEFIVLDEPTSALDVSVRGRIISLFVDLKRMKNLTYVFISHDLSVVKYICDNVAVMYLGTVVECGRVRDIFKIPLHPYTYALISAIPIPDPVVRKERIVLKGEVPPPTNLPPYCLFYSRCFRRLEICGKERPPAIAVGDSHTVSCWLHDTGGRG